MPSVSIKCAGTRAFNRRTQMAKKNRIRLLTQPKSSSICPSPWPSPWPSPSPWPFHLDAEAGTKRILRISGVRLGNSARAKYPMSKAQTNPAVHHQNPGIAYPLPDKLDKDSILESPNHCPQDSTRPGSVNSASKATTSAPVQSPKKEPRPAEIPQGIGIPPVLSAPDPVSAHAELEIAEELRREASKKVHNPAQIPNPERLNTCPDPEPTAFQGPTDPAALTGMNTCPRQATERPRDRTLQVRIGYQSANPFALNRVQARVPPKDSWTEQAPLTRTAQGQPITIPATRSESTRQSVLPKGYPWPYPESDPDRD